MLTPKLIYHSENEAAGIQATRSLKRVLRPQILIIPRRDCIYRVFSLRAKSRSGLAAARLTARKELAKSFPKNRERSINFHYQNDVKTGRLGVTAWEHMGQSPHRAYPENAAFKPLDSGYRLVRCRSGFEGQFWEAGFLTSSRWWNNLPDSNEWSIFIRWATPDDHLELHPRPTPVTPPLRTDIPFLNISHESLKQSLSPMRVIAFIIFVFSSLFLFQLGHLARLSFSQQSMEDEVALLTTPSEEILSVRRRSLALLVNEEANISSTTFKKIQSFLKDVDDILIKNFSVSEVNVPSQNERDPSEGLLEDISDNIRAPFNLSILELDDKSVTILLTNVDLIDLGPFIRELESLQMVESANASPTGRDSLKISINIFSDQGP